MSAPPPADRAAAARDDARDDRLATDAAAQTLALRARRLARRADDDATAFGGARAGTHVDFTLARERFLLDAAHVLAAFPLAAITPLPGAAPPVVGLTAWRGLVLTLVDLRRAAGVHDTGLDDLATVLVIGHPGRPVAGFLADVVHGVVARDPAHALRPAPPARGALPGVVGGVTDDAHLVLDGARLLAFLEDEPLPAAATVPLPPPSPDPQ